MDDPYRRSQAAATFATTVPRRLDRLPWSRFHWLVVIALGITWVLDGLEVTLVGSLSGAIAESPVLHLSSQQIGAAASFYLIGGVTGALLFGWLADRHGRKRMFSITVSVYLAGTLLTGLSWNFPAFSLFRFITGAGIGGEYVAVNATIQELVPARYRGRTDLIINGTFWIGAALGALGAVAALDRNLIDPELGWRLAFLLGAAIGGFILALRRYLPESPRWQITHGRAEAAEVTMAAIEARVAAETGQALADPAGTPLILRRHERGWFLRAAGVLLREYRARVVLCVALMTAQAFCYNAVFFTYALILTRFYAIPSGDVGLFILPFAAGNFLGPLLLGRLFDTIGRRAMIGGTYMLAGALLIAAGWLFASGRLDATQQTAVWAVIFFFASAAASSAYLTAGEVFPLEMRGVAIALFYAFGTALGGVTGPLVFGALIASGHRADIAWGYALGGALMLGAGVLAAGYGVTAERRPLEDVAPPLSSRDT